MARKSKKTTKVKKEEPSLPVKGMKKAKKLQAKLKKELGLEEKMVVVEEKPEVELPVDLGSLGLTNDGEYSADSGSDSDLEPTMALGDEEEEMISEGEDFVFQDDDEETTFKVEEEPLIAEPVKIEEEKVEKKEKKEKKKKKKKAKKGDDAKEETAEKEEKVAAEPTKEEAKRTATRSILTKEKFADLDICDSLKSTLASSNFEFMTEIQAKTIKHTLDGQDVLGAARTGSGKTLAFLIPAIELLIQAQYKPRNGTGVIIITPTRELALQIFGVARDLMADGTQTFGVCMGGANRRTEADKLIKGVNLLIATPGRLLDHLQNTRGFVYKSCRCLVIDEADRILEIGFEEDMKAILNILPKERQALLFSATQTQNVRDLARLSLKKPEYVGVHDEDESSTVAGLEQGYCVVPSEDRFLLLFTFLKRNTNKKIIVFFSSCNSVKFHAELFNYIQVPVLELHLQGKQKQQKRTNTFFEFCNATKGTLFCTDVAARGLDIPDVDWIIQYDPPDDPREYIHRVGRTARAGGKGRALLFLLPEEMNFLKYLYKYKVTLNEYEFGREKLINVQAQLEKLVDTTHYLYTSAKEGMRSYLQAYSTHQLKDVFNVHLLSHARVARAFGFQRPPKIQLRNL